MHHSCSLLKFQIGPVQEFIAQARSTRDLWSGSYLLSWLAAAGIKEVRRRGGTVIFPATEHQPLLEDPLRPDADGLLIPNLPNIFIASIPEAVAESVAKMARGAIEAEWKAIATSVWEQRQKIELLDGMNGRFFAQAERHLSISSQITSPGSQDYSGAYSENGWILDAVRQTRDFKAWDKGGYGAAKDSLSGKEEALVGGEEYRRAMEEKHSKNKNSIDGAYAALFAKHADHLGAVGIIKRCWHLAYLNYAHQPRLNTRTDDFPIRSIPAIASREWKHDDNELPQEKTDGEKYIAAIAFDGDGIGKWVNGCFLKDQAGLERFHGEFSAALSSFAAGVIGMVERKEHASGDPQSSRTVPMGQLIYAGGDDVVALVPADAALAFATELREAFKKTTQHIIGEELHTLPDGKQERQSFTPDASAGIAITHIKSPLQDLIRAAQDAEKRAKNTVGRPAFSITTMKRSGEITDWGARWDSGGAALYEAIAAALKTRKLSSKFPHRVCQLLEPYLTERSGLMKHVGDASGFDASAVILVEFTHAVERQSAKNCAADNWQKLRPLLETYLNSILAHRAQNPPAPGRENKRPTEIQELLRAVIGLCTTVAFACRISLSSEAERQPAA